MNTRPSLPLLISTRHQGGFVLPVVVFLIVVLAGAAVAISQLTVESAAVQNQALQKTRAQYFAQSGLEWATHQLIQGEVQSDDCDPEESLLEDEDRTHPDFPGLELTITCTHNDYGNLTLWNFEASAYSVDLSPDDEEYVWQRMTAVVER